MADTSNIVSPELANVIGNLDNVIADVSKQLSDAVTHYGPDAVNLVLMSYRIDAIGQLSKGGICVAAMAALHIIVMKFVFNPLSKIRKAAFQYDMNNVIPEGDYHKIMSYEDAATFTFMAVTAYSVLQFFLLLGSYFFLADISAWIAAFGYPELRIAMKALYAASLM